MTLRLADDSIFAGAGRAKALARWLAEVPDNAHTLSLAVRDRDTQSVEVIARWPAPHAVDDTWSAVDAHEWGAKIEQLIQDYVEEIQGTVLASVRWSDANSEVLAQKRLKVSSDRGKDPFDSFSANPQATLGQLMQHQQVLMENLTNVTQYTVVEGAKRAEHAYDRMLQLELKNQELRTELEELRAQSIEDAAVQTIERHTERDPVAERAEKMLELVIAKWMASSGGGAKLPPE